MCTCQDNEEEYLGYKRSWNQGGVQLMVLNKHGQNLKCRLQMLLNHPIEFGRRNNGVMVWKGSCSGGN